MAIAPRTDPRPHVGQAGGSLCSQMLPLPFRPQRLDDDFPIGLPSEATLQIVSLFDRSATLGAAPASMMSIPISGSGCHRPRAVSADGPTSESQLRTVRRSEVAHRRRALQDRWPATGHRYRARPQRLRTTPDLAHPMAPERRPVPTLSSRRENSLASEFGCRPAAWNESTHTTNRVGIVDFRNSRKIVVHCAIALALDSMSPT
jgi:hypothetical protein